MKQTEIGPGVFIVEFDKEDIGGGEEVPIRSADCKERLVELYPKSSEADWKRVSKKQIDGMAVRVFVNKKTNDQVTAVEDGDSINLYESGPDSPMLFYAATGQLYGDECEDGMTFVMFAPKKFWDRNHYIPDWHMQWYLENVLQAPKDYLDEASENQFMVEDSLEDTIATLQACGFVFEPEMAKAGQWED